MKDRHQVAPYPLRLTAELKQDVMRAAAAMGRSFNSEVAARLTASFEEPSHAHLSASVQEAIKNEQTQRGGTADEALTRLVMAGQSQGGTVVKLSIEPGTTLAQVQAMVGAAAKLLPADASVLLEGR